MRSRLARLLGTTALVAAGFTPAAAQDSTWLSSPGSGNFNSPTNWVSGVPTGTAFFGASDLTGLWIDTLTNIGGWTFNGDNLHYSFTTNAVLNFTGHGIIDNGSSVLITNSSFVVFGADSTAGNAIINNNHNLYFNGSSNAGAATITNDGNDFVSFNGSTSAGNATITNNNGNLYFHGSSSAEDATITNNDLLSVSVNATAGSALITNNSEMHFAYRATAGSATIINNGLLEFLDSSRAGNATITTANGGLTRFYTAGYGDDARFITESGGTFDVSTFAGSAGTAGSIEGAGLHILGDKTLTVGSNGRSTEVSGVISGAGGTLVKTGTGTLTLSGSNDYTGSTTVNGGTLLVNGTIAASGLTTVNVGATLGGSGIVGATTINGGSLAPGNSIGTLTIRGDLVMTTAASYLVEISPADADRTTVTGIATLAGAVTAQFAPGSYLTRTYTLLHAAGGRAGTTFDSFTTANLPAGLTARLTYTENDVLLNLVGTIGVDDSLNRNQQNVASALNDFFNRGGALPPGFVTASGFTGSALGAALSQLSGENATGIQSASHLSMGLFLNTMLNPFVTGRTTGVGATMAFAADRSMANAYAAAWPAGTPAAPRIEQRWSVWGTAYGGRNRIEGESTAGSNDTSAQTGGFALGADYRVSGDTVVGAAVAIGETGWGVAGLGGGDSNVAQVGGYASTRLDATYLSAALAGAWHDVSIQRTLTIAGADHLEAGFDARAFGSRVEAGRRFGELHGITPYAAVQVQSLRTPDIRERAKAGSGQFALSYAAQTVTDTRSEVGAWFDTRRLLGDGSQITLRARAAWAHDFDPESRVNATFQTLPGASFTVDGAAAASNAALASVVAELTLPSGWQLVGTFDGEFSNRTRTLAGTGTLRYAW